MSDAKATEPSDSESSGRRAQRTLAVTAALLILGGGAAVTFGVVNDDPPPTPPSAETSGSLRPPSAGETTSTPNGNRQSTADADVTMARPTQIRVAAIGVRSQLTKVGLNPDGTLEVPQPGPDYDKAAWFRGSPAPGEVGPAVIEGHVDGPIDGPSVFYRLGELQPDDTVMVTSRDGEVTRFKVYAVRLYPKSDFPTLEVYGNTEGPELRLITCGGRFDPDRTAGGYTSNVVVYAREA